MNLMPWLIKKIRNWIWYRHGKVRYRIWLDEDRYIISATNGEITVHDCYGGTHETAKNLALFKLHQALSDKEKKQKWITKGNGYELFRIK